MAFYVVYHFLSTASCPAFDSQPWLFYSNHSISLSIILSFHLSCVLFNPQTSQIDEKKRHQQKDSWSTTSNVEEQMAIKRPKLKKSHKKTAGEQWLDVDLKDRKKKATQENTREQFFKRGVQSDQTFSGYCERQTVFENKTIDDHDHDRENVSQLLERLRFPSILSCPFLCFLETWMSRREIISRIGSQWQDMKTETEKMIQDEDELRKKGREDGTVVKDVCTEPSPAKKVGILLLLMQELLTGFPRADTSLWSWFPSSLFCQRDWVSPDSPDSKSQSLAVWTKAKQRE